MHICVPTNPPILAFHQVCRGSTWTLLRITPGWSWVQSDAPVPVQTSPSAIRHGGLWPHVPFPSMFSFKFILDWTKLKLDENLGRDEFIHDSQRCLSFISYASTCYLWNLHNRITWSFVYWPSWYNEMWDMFFLIQSLGDLSKRLKWGNSHALSTLQKSYPEPYMNRVEPT